MASPELTFHQIIAGLKSGKNYTNNIEQEDGSVHRVYFLYSPEPARPTMFCMLHIFNITTNKLVREHSLPLHQIFDQGFVNEGWEECEYPQLIPRGFIVN